MKIRNIWLLISVMVVTFGVLIWLQVSYMSSLVGIQTSEFDGAVHRSLSQVVYMLEQDETRRYLDNELEDRERDVLVRSSVLQMIPPFPDMFFQEMEDSASVLGGIGYFQNKVRAYSNGKSYSYTLKDEDFQDKLRDRYLHERGLLEDVVLRILYEANDLPISQRVDFNKLGNYLSKEFSNSGLIGLPFSYKVVDKKGKDVYFSEDYERNVSPDYKQPLFVNDAGGKHAMLYVYFPKRQEYIRQPLIMFIPTISFSIILLFVFSFTVVVILRQKKLSDMKNDFISNMTHELKTPVSSVSLAAQMLKDKDVIKDAEKISRIVSIISDETKRLNLLIEKVLQMSLFERNGKSNLTFNEVEVNDTIETVVASFKMKVSSCGGILTSDLRATEATVLADELHLTNVLFNLMDNAVKYRDENRPLNLLVTTKDEGKNLVIAIKDNGIGIKKEDLKRIFERFYRVPKGNVHNVKGFGLGLAYVADIIESHKGDISVESEYGAGTTFTIYLPLIKI